LGNFFNFASLCIEMDISLEKFVQILKEYFRSDVIGHEKGNIEKFNDLVVAGMIDHENFHCRQFMSSSIGYLLYVLKQQSIYTKTKYLNNIPLKEFSEYNIKNKNQSRDLRDFQHDYKDSIPNECILLYCEMVVITTELELLSNFAKYEVNSFYGQRNAIENLGGFNILPIFSNVQQPNDEMFDTYKKSCSLLEIIEGLATWREFIYVTWMTLLKSPLKLHDYTNRWLKLSENKGRYRNAANLIYKCTNCNMSMLFTGVILDIALNSPVFSEDEKSWKEVHPSLRLAEILAISDKIPKYFKSANNLILVNKEYYLELEYFICKKLKWSPNDVVIKETEGALKRRIAYGKELSMQGQGTDILGQFYERHFARALRYKREHPAFHLFHWLYSKNEDIFKSTQPIACFLIDDLYLNILESDSSGIYAIYLLDIVFSLAVESIINNNIFSEYSHQNFIKAHNIFDMATSTIPDIKNTYENFESFLLKKLGYHGRAHCPKVYMDGLYWS